MTLVDALKQDTDTIIQCFKHVFPALYFYLKNGQKEVDTIINLCNTAYSYRATAKRVSCTPGMNTTRILGTLMY